MYWYFIIIYLLSFVLVFNWTLFYLDDYKFSHNKLIRYSQILSPILLVLFLFLFYYELLNIIKGRSSIDGSLSYLIGLVIYVGNGSACAVHLIFSDSLLHTYKVALWVFLGGVIGGCIYLITIQFL